MAQHSYVLAALSAAWALVSSALDAALSAVLYAVWVVWTRTGDAALRGLYFHGPAIPGVGGFWVGAHDVDACAQLTGLPSAYFRGPDGGPTRECVELRETKFVAFLYGFGLALLLFVGYQVVSCLRWRLLVQTLLQGLRGARIVRSRDGDLQFFVGGGSPQVQTQPREGSAAGTVQAHEFNAKWNGLLEKPDSRRCLSCVRTELLADSANYAGAGGAGASRTAASFVPSYVPSLAPNSGDEKGITRGASGGRSRSHRSPSNDGNPSRRRPHKPPVQPPRNSKSISPLLSQSFQNTAPVLVPAAVSSVMPMAMPMAMHMAMPMASNAVNAVDASLIDPPLPPPQPPPPSPMTLRFQRELAQLLASVKPAEIMDGDTDVAPSLGVRTRGQRSSLVTASNAAMFV